MLSSTQTHICPQAHHATHRTTHLTMQVDHTTSTCHHPTPQNTSLQMLTPLITAPMTNPSKRNHRPTSHLICTPNNLPTDRRTHLATQDAYCVTSSTCLHSRLQLLTNETTAAMQDPSKQNTRTTTMITTPLTNPSKRKHRPTSHLLCIPNNLPTDRRTHHATQDAYRVTSSTCLHSSLQLLTNETAAMQDPSTQNTRTTSHHMCPHHHLPNPILHSAAQSQCKFNVEPNSDFKLCPPICMPITLHHICCNTIHTYAPTPTQPAPPPLPPKLYQANYTHKHNNTQCSTNPTNHQQPHSTTFPCHHTHSQNKPIPHTHTHKHCSNNDQQPPSTTLNCHHTPTQNIPIPNNTPTTLPPPRHTTTYPHCHQQLDYLSSSHPS